jgi:Ca2+-transporting ATPase
MAKKNAIIRKLPAVETLGSSTVIASDKTGTLTQNHMEVVETWVSKNDIKLLLQLGAMCTDCILSYKSGQILVDGEPTESAIVDAALKSGENKDDLYEEMNRINDIPFESSRKLMSTIHRYGNKYRIITKGAPDVLIKKCILTDYDKAKIKKINDNMAEKALRVIAVGYKDLDYLPSKIDESLEQNLNFVGLIGMIDPPREGVKEAVNTCYHAGIKTVMITGDHIITAKSIAEQLGILKSGDIAITGEELDKIPQDKLKKDIDKYSVFARVSPEHKVRIVKAFRSRRRCCCNDR